MLSISTLEDNVRIEAESLGQPTEHAITHVLEKTFINKVISDVGLVITLYDIISLGEGALYHSDGGVHYKVTFRVVVFKPFPGEMLIGTVKDMHANGIKVDLGFFDDVHIPSEMLQQPAQWNESEKEWSWLQIQGEEDDADEEEPKEEKEGGGGEAEAQPPLFYTKSGEIRIKIHCVRYHPIPSLVVQAEQKAAGLPVEGTAAFPHSPMTVIGRADGTGLGMIGWAWG